jgi:hypothetical protein
MATLLGNLATRLAPADRRGWVPADEFVFGAPATRFELVRDEIASIFHLLRTARDEDSPPLGLALAKLAAFVAVGVAITTLVAVGLGTVAARAVTSFVG